MQDKTHQRSHDLWIIPPLVLMLILWTIGIVEWFAYHDPLTLIFWGYIGLFVGAGIGGYIAVQDRYRPYMRRLIIILLGGLLLVVAIVTDHGNMQLEGLFFALIAGGGSYVVLHYAIAKIIGPLIFGRVWCGWACWYGMIFDLLPYPFSHYRIPGKWVYLRYVHFGLSLLLVALLWFGVGFNGADGNAGMLWFVLGVLFYYVIGIAAAFALKDNRAFCKYLCPISVPLKLSSRYALVKISGTSTHCTDCEACVEMCPMNIRVKDYIVAEKRVLSSECTLCLSCVNACPHDSLKLSIGFDISKSGRYDHDTSPGNRDYRRGIRDTQGDLIVIPEADAEHR